MSQNNTSQLTLRERQAAFWRSINPLVHFSVRRYVFSIAFFIGIVVFGLVSIRSVGVDLLPSITIPVVNVSTSYAGASPESVDTELTQKVESALAQVTGVSSMSSSSSSGQSYVTLQFNDGVDQNAAVNQVSSLIASVSSRLPTGTGTPSIRTFNPNASPIVEFGLSGGRASQSDVYDYAQNVLVPALQRVEGVADVSLSGGTVRQVQVLLNPDKMAASGLNPADVSNAITSSNVSSSIGTITRNDNTLAYSTNSTLGSLNDVGNVLIDSARGIHVSDVATVRDNSTVSSYTRINGLPVVLVSLQQSSGSNAVNVVDSVRRATAAMKLPQGYSITYSNDTTGPIRSAISNTLHEMWITALVVALVTLLFLGRLNTAVTVIAAIPISLAAAPILYKLLGFTFNQVSLLALIVAIGIVVDDSIVVAENVERLRAAGYSRVQAVLKGASEVFGAVAAASLSLLAVLIPVSFIGGIIGEYVRQFALGLAVAVAMSWLEALLFLTVRMAYTPDARALSWRDVPSRFAKLPADLRWGFASIKTAWFALLAVTVLLVIWSTVRTPYLYLGVLLLPLVLGLLRFLWGIALAVLEALTTSLSSVTNRILGFFRDGYARSLDEALDFSPLVLLFALGFLVLTALIAVPKLSSGFTPNSDSGSFSARLRVPSSLSLAKSNALVARMENYFLRQSDVKTVQTSVSSNGASVNVTLKPISQRDSITTLTSKYQRALRNMYPDYPNVRANILSMGGFRGTGSQQSLTLIATNFNLLKERAAQAVSVLENDPNVLSASSSLDNTTLEHRFVPDPHLLAGTGLTSSSVASVLQGYGSGVSAGKVVINNVTYPVQVQVDPARLSDEQSLLSLPIYSGTLKTALALSQLGTVTQVAAPSRISRDNRVYSLSLTYQPDTASTLSTAQLQARLTIKLAQAGVTGNLVLLGDDDAQGAAALGRNVSGLGVQAFGLSLLLVYLVMASQFNSFRYPVYLLLPVPFAVAGALWVTALAGGGLDIFGMLGFLLLIGLSAKNAIIYLEFVVEQLKELPLREAMLEASKLRFRPIMMTTLTVLVISLPLLLNKGSGAEYGKSISLVIMGGVTVSALMTFYVVPAAFYLFERGHTERNAAKQAEQYREEEKALMTVDI